MKNTGKDVHRDRAATGYTDSLSAGCFISNTINVYIIISVRHVPIIIMREVRIKVKYDDVNYAYGPPNDKILS